MNTRRAALRALALLAMAAPLARGADPTPTPTPVPNKTSLRSFAGTYQGRSQVVLGSARPYRGGAQFHIVAPGDTALSFRITGRVKTSAGPVAIDNQLRFLSSGVMTGRHLAPGIARRAPFIGLYTAKGRRITFTGTYEFSESATGTFKGQIFHNAKGRLFLDYAIYTSDAADALYRYTYSAIRPKKKSWR